jgi:hypothetical protein
MEYLESDLGWQSSGSVRVDLRGTEANVLLLDGPNLHRFRNAQDYDHYGGHYKTSPVFIGIPHGAHWHVVVNLGGYGGRVDATIKMMAA